MNLEEKLKEKSFTSEYFLTKPMYIPEFILLSDALSIAEEAMRLQRNELLKLFKEEVGLCEEGDCHECDAIRKIFNTDIKTSFPDQSKEVKE